MKATAYQPGTVYLMHRVVLIFVTVAVLLCGMSAAPLVVGSAAASESTTEASLNIAYCNLSFDNEVHLFYAIPSAAEGVKLLLWTTPQSVYDISTASVQLEPLSEQMEIQGSMYTVFTFTGFTAKRMVDTVYARAYLPGETDAYGATLKYSVLQYAYNRLGKTAVGSTNEDFKALLVSMLDYGAASQTYQGYRTDRLATMDFYQVKLSGGVLVEDGFRQGLYLAGDQIAVTAPATDAAGASFSHWADSLGNTVGTAASCTITVGARNETYTAVYVHYSEGLEYETNDDGTCYLIGRGSCTDTELRIPPISPDGDTVIGIDRASFTDDTLTSISIPATVVEIGRNAFKGCTALTDVYYASSEDDWMNNVDIGSGNGPLEDAAVHYGIVETFTVTFLGYDGTVLKTETVRKGEAAVAPAAPQRDGYEFTGWSGAFGEVVSDLTVTAQYASTSREPAITVQSVTVDKGASEVSVVVSLRNDPGIMNMTLDMQVDDSVFGFKSATKGVALPDASLTVPGPMTTASPYRFILDAISVTDGNQVDGALFTIVLSIKDTTVTGSYDISFTYEDGDIIDENFVPVDVLIENGVIKIQ